VAGGRANQRSEVTEPGVIERWNVLLPGVGRTGVQK
jgi:hypothetical protein